MLKNRLDTKYQKTNDQNNVTWKEGAISNFPGYISGKYFTKRLN